MSDTACHWKDLVTRYKTPVLKRSIWQLVNTLVPYLALWALMIWAIGHSYWLTIPLALLAAGFMVRIFIIFHDCTHGSFFQSRRANEVVGFLAGVLTFTPYHLWRREHALHHGTAGDLDRRGTGDIWTLTVDEYIAASPRKRLAYRVVRNPFVLFFLAPAYLFLVRQRFPSRDSSRHERNRIAWTNISLLSLAAVGSLAIGWQSYLSIQLTVLLVSGSAGVWLFYVQHQFEEVYWAPQGEWSFELAALRGSSFYKLPRVLQWFSGNIGYHHLHHLSPAIPNYNLERCHDSHVLFQQVPTLTLRTSLRSLRFRFFDEQRNRLIGMREFRALRRNQSRVSR